MTQALTDNPIESLQFRSITTSDEDILAEIYASTRREELAPLIDWSKAQKEAFLRQQFEYQHHYYQQTYTDATYELITQRDEVLGRLYVDRREEEIRIVDIALLPEHRGRGIGGAIIQSLLDEAGRRDHGKVVRIHVEHNNPALRLYQRLGFRQIEDKGVYKLLEWRPAAVIAKPAKNHSS
jgi:ribosomal protein S18 acetylase RimI-like enzyme